MEKIDKMIGFLQKAKEGYKIKELFDKMKTENTKLKREIEELRKGRRFMTGWIKKLEFVLMKQYSLFICTQCHGEGGRDDGMGDGGVCETCGGMGFIDKKSSVNKKQNGR